MKKRSTSDVERSQSEQIEVESNVVNLVNLIRDFECEASFAEIKSYLQYYIKMFGKKYRIPGCDSDEIEQECLFALRYKAVEDFDSTRGKFKNFAILCIKRHLFSLIKANNQQKRTVLNTSLSLDEDRSNGDNLPLIHLITEDTLDAPDQLSKTENDKMREDKLLLKLSPLECEVYKLYIKQMTYEEIVLELKKVLPAKRISKKTIDNALCRLKFKAQNLGKNIDWCD